jgi:DNA invertase Pin-like site-specific DNA recombinase
VQDTHPGGQTLESSHFSGPDMPAHFGKFVSYYRVSTDRQGRSGLGLEAQKEAVQQRLNGGPWQLVAEFVEVESGKRGKRPQLDAALSACKKHKAKLVVAKLDRLSRNVSFLLKLIDSGVEVLFADLPELNGAMGRFMLTTMASVAELEAGLISERTKAALKAAKARGVRLGRHGAEVLAPKYRKEARQRAEELQPRHRRAEGKWQDTGSAYLLTTSAPHPRFCRFAIDESIQSFWATNACLMPLPKHTMSFLTRSKRYGGHHAPSEETLEAEASGMRSTLVGGRRVVVVAGERRNRGNRWAGSARNHSG